MWLTNGRTSLPSCSRILSKPLGACWRRPGQPAGQLRRCATAQHRLLPEPDPSINEQIHRLIPQLLHRLRIKPKWILIHTRSLNRRRPGPDQSWPPRRRQLVAAEQGRGTLRTSVSHQSSQEAGSLDRSPSRRGEQEAELDSSSRHERTPSSHRSGKLLQQSSHSPSTRNRPGRAVQLWLREGQMPRRRI